MVFHIEQNNHSVSIYTQVYNTKPFLARCVDSVLNQTFRDFEYVLIDNGSTDGCKELLEQYVLQDARVRLVCFEKNTPSPIWLKVVQETANGSYIANLDSDDWWEPDYLESLIGFLERNRLDLAVTGTVNYFEESRTSRVMRQLKEPVVLPVRRFAAIYPQLWTFPSTIWAAVMKADLFQKTDFSDIITEKLSNGADTICMLKYMEHCERIGIDNTALYHYRIRAKQVSRSYNSRRFDSNVYFYGAVRHFLERYHAFDEAKQAWVKVVYFNLINTTLRLLAESNLTADEKIAECVRIASHPLTAAALSHACPEREQWFQTVWKIVLNAAEDRAFTDTGALQSVLAILAPRCGPAVTKDAVALFLRNPDFMSVLYQDAPERLVNILLESIAAKRYIKQYDLAGMLRTLAADKPLLRGLSDTQFLRRYYDVYRLVWEEKYLEALDRMTGMLLEGTVRKAENTFLQLYLSLAAQLEQVPAFLFGKIRLAQYFLRQNRTQEAASVVKELEEMGAADNEEIMELRTKLIALAGGE